MPGARTRVVNPIILATSWDYKILNVRIGKISLGLQSVTQMSVKTLRARFTLLHQSYDNAKVTIELQWTSNLPNILRRMQGFLTYDLLAKS